jgi:hypothetical protein
MVMNRLVPVELLESSLLPLVVAHDCSWPMMAHILLVLLVVTGDYTLEVHIRPPVGRILSRRLVIVVHTLLIADC